MARKKLTKTVVDDLTATDPRGERYSDTDFHGFGVTVYPNGRKVFWIIYKPPKAAAPGFRKRITCEREYGQITLKDAQDWARERFKELAQGIDPALKRETERAMPTYGTWVDEYLTVVKRRKKQPQHDEYHLLGPRGGRGHEPKHSPAMARWRDLPLDAITPSEIEAWMLSITERVRGEKKPRGTGTTTANRAYAALRACFEEAVRKKVLKDNPCRFVRKNPENTPRQRTLSDEELARVFNAVDAREDPFERALFRLLLETGARKTEALSSRWVDLDLDGKPPLWTIPSPKAGKPQTIPLPKQTAKMLRDLPHMGEWVFPGKLPGTHRVEVKIAWSRILEAAKVTGVTIHDCRRTYGLAVAKSAGILAASKLLRHSTVSITAKVYAPLGAKDLLPFAEKLIKSQAKAVKAEDVRAKQAGAKVLPMKPKRKVG
jgi:integrase